MNRFTFEWKFTIILFTVTVHHHLPGVVHISVNFLRTLKFMHF